MLVVHRCASDELVEQHLCSFLECSDAVQLFMAIIDCLRHEYESPDTKGSLKKVGTTSFSAQLATALSLNTSDQTNN